MTQFEFAGLVVLAGMLGGIVGLERELAKRPAGLRTHMLVAAAAASVVLLNDVIFEHLLNVTTDPDSISSDPGRIIQAIFVGVGFIGGGTILKSRRSDEVHYLSTAASILFASTLGIAVALKLFLLAGLMVFFSLFINRGVYRFEVRFLDKEKKIP